MFRKICAFASIFIIFLTCVYADGEKNFYINLDFSEAAYTEFGFSGGPVTSSNNLVTALDPDGIKIQTGRSDTDSSTNLPTALYPSTSSVYAYWNIVSENSVQLGLRIEKPLLPWNWIVETETPENDAPKIAWSVSWNDPDYGSGIVSSNNVSVPFVLLNNESSIIDSVQLTINVDPVTEIGRYVADVYSSSLILEVISQ